MEEVTVAEGENVDNNPAAVIKMENVDNNLATISKDIEESKDVAITEKNESTEILHEEDKESDENLKESEEALKEDEETIENVEQTLKEDAETVENTVEVLKKNEETLEKNEEIFKIDKHEKETVEEEDEKDDCEIIPGSVAVDENTILFTEDGKDTMLDESVEELYEPQVDIFAQSFNNTGELEEQVDIDEPECIKKKINYKHPCDRKSRSSKNRKSQSMNNKSTRSRVNVNKIEEQILNKKSGHRKKLNGSQKAKFATQLENKLNSGNRSPNEEIIEEQCRVCLSKEAGLVNIFTTDKTRLSAAAKIMQIAPGVKIERKDSLPQRICDTCLESVNVAFNLKTLCECTDKDLRSRLQKAKVVTKSGRLTAIVKLERLKEESEESIDDEDNDANFKVESNVSESIDSDTDVSYEPPKKKKWQKKRMTRSQQKKHTSTATTSDGNKTYLPKTTDEDMSTENEDDETNGDDKNSRKRRAANRRSTSENDTGDKKKPYPCPYCKEVLPSTSKFKQHRKIHTAEGPFKCEICGKEFKFIKSFTVHLENHKKQDDLKCEQCDISFTNKNEHRRHMLNMTKVHGENSKNFICERCNKSFTAKVRLEHHQKTSCNDLKKKKSKLDVESQTVGKDLFKFVAPITTTYWSDSFSD